MLIGNSLVRYGFVPGVICLSSASGILGMSNEADLRYSLYSDEISEPISARYFNIIPVDNLAEVETQKVGSLTVTTPLRTIIDMIRHDCAVEFVCDSLDWWESKYGNLGDVEKSLKQYGLYEKYMSDYYPFFEDKSYL